MSTDQHRTTPHDADDKTTGRHHHSALEEFGRDERRPAMLLLGALVIAAVFFAFGILLGRWMADADDNNNASRQLPPGTVNPPSATPAAPSTRP